MSIRDFGVALVRHAPWMEKVARGLYACMPERLKDTPTTFLRRLFRNADVVRFVQIGAFDGVAGDPIRSLVISDARWRGVLVEPQPTIFKRLQTNYAAQADRLTFLQHAVSGENGARALYFISKDEIARLGLPEWAGEIASFDESHVKKHFPQAFVENLIVPVITLSEIIPQCGLKKIDLVVMDVEGHERSIIESTDWQALGISACVFEHKHMSEEEFAGLQRLFHTNGFVLKLYGRDAIAFRAV